MPHEAQNPAIPLPFDDLGSKGFENFVAAFLSAQPTLDILEVTQDERAPDGLCSQAVPHRVIEASPYAALSGLSQDGIDLTATTASGQKWAIQCRHYKTYNAGKSTSAMDDAEARFPNADRYFLFISGEPTADAIKLVEERSSHRWEIWGGTKISLQFRQSVPRANQPDIIRSVFGDSARRIIETLYPLDDELLVPPEQFFAAWLRPDRVFHHRSQLVGREAVLQRLHDFAASPSERVCILPAPGGRGKSRLLLEFATTFPTRNRDRRLWFVNPAPVPAAAPGALRTAPPNEVVVVQDDAHRIETVRQDLLQLLASERLHGKILLAARPQAVASLQALALQAGFESSAIVTLEPLAKLARRDLTALAAAQLDPEHRDHAEFLSSRAGDCPLIVTVGAELINRGQLELNRLLSSAAFYREVFARFEAQAFTGLAYDPHFLTETLATIALLAPWSERDGGLDELARFLGRTPGVLRDLIQHLRAAELLVASGKGIRPAPDLYADFLCFRACYTLDGRLTDFARQIQTAYAATAGPQMLRNLAETEWQAVDATGLTAESLLEPFWRTELDAFRAADFWDRSQIVKRWTAFAIYQPKRSLALASLALHDQNAAPPPVGQEPRADRFSLHTHQQVLTELPALLEPIAIYHDEHRVDALDLLWALHGKSPPDRVHHQISALNSIAKIGSFTLHHPLTAARDLLNWLERLLRLNDGRSLLETRDSVLATLLKPVFNRRLDASYSEGLTVHISHPPVSVSQTRPFRDHALRIIREVIVPASELATLNILTVLEAAIGPDGPAVGGTPMSPGILRSWLAERHKALSVVAEILQRYPSARVHFRVRKMLRHLSPGPKRRQNRFDQEVNAILATIPDTPELRWHRAVCSRYDDEFFDYRDCSEDDIQTHLKTAEKKWFEFVAMVARELLAKYPDPEDLVTEMEARLVNHRRYGETTFLGPLFDALGQQQPDGGRALLRAILDRPTSICDGAWSSLIYNQVDFPDAELVTWSQQILAGNNLSRQRTLLNWLTATAPQDLPPAIFDALNRWSRHAKGEAASLLIGTLRWTRRADDPVWLTLLNGLDLMELTPDQTDELLESLGQNVRYNDTRIPEAFALRLLQHLATVRELHRSKSVSLIEHFADTYPLATYKMLYQRVETAHLKQEPEPGFVPLPHHEMWRLKRLPETPAYRNLANTLLDRVRSESAAEWSWGLLYQGSVLRVSDLGVELLATWLPVIQKPDELRRLLNALKFEGSMIIFEQPEFVRKLLRKAKQIDPTELDYWSYKIADTSGPSVRGYTNRKLDDKYRYYEIAAAKAESRHADDPELRRFYAEIIAREQRLSSWHANDEFEEPQN